MQAAGAGKGRGELPSYCGCPGQNTTSFMDGASIFVAWEKRMRREQFPGNHSVFSGGLQAELGENFMINRNTTNKN